MEFSSLHLAPNLSAQTLHYHINGVPPFDFEVCVVSRMAAWQQTKIDVSETILQKRWECNLAGISLFGNAIQDGYALDVGEILQVQQQQEQE